MPYLQISLGLGFQHMNLRGTHSVHDRLICLCYEWILGLQSLQSCPTLCKPMDYSSLGYSVHVETLIPVICLCYELILGVQSLQSCPTLCKPMDYSSLGSSVHEIFQARILEWVDISFSMDFPDPGNEPSPALVGRFFTTSTTWESRLN